MSTNKKITKITITCSSCEMKYILAYNDTSDETPEYCPFCGEGVDLDTEEDDGDE